jgi:hypothetical protein
VWGDGVMAPSLRSDTQITLDRLSTARPSSEPASWA